MLSKEDLQAIAELMDIELAPIKENLEQIEVNISKIKEAQNRIVKWIDFYYKDEKPFPVKN